MQPSRLLGVHDRDGVEVKAVGRYVRAGGASFVALVAYADETPVLHAHIREVNCISGKAIGKDGDVKGYDEIKRILTKDFGFVDLAAYRSWIENVRPTLPPTLDLIQKLSPDTIDCRAFWKVCDDLFGHDPVFNVVAEPKVGTLPFAIETPMDANRMNLRFAKSFRVIPFLDENAHQRLNMLEIGPGDGSIKNSVETCTSYSYIGVDVVPRVPGVVETTPEGFSPMRF